MACPQAFSILRSCALVDVQDRAVTQAYSVMQVAIPLLQTLEVVHQQGIVHRDIKPENLFLEGSGGMKVGDWGLAINQLQEKAYSRVGTLDYMAPEVPHYHPASSHCPDPASGCIALARGRRRGHC